MNNDQHILVTGGSGFIGRNLVKTLYAENHTVSILSRNPSSFIEIPNDVACYEADITLMSSLPSFTEFDTVIHCAGQVSVSDSLSNPVDTFEVNTLGTQNILEKSRKGNVDNFVYISSAAVYGKPNLLPMKESSDTQCLHPYASSKLAGEHLVESYVYSYGLTGIVARCFTVYGPGQQSNNLVPEVIEQISSGSSELSLGNIEPTRDFVYIDDICSGVRTLLSSVSSGFSIYNIGCGVETQVRDLINMIIDEFNHDITIKETSRGRSESIEINRMVADVNKLKSLGWNPSYIPREGIRMTVAKSSNNTNK
jgi:nucleoside-diphosphate-sugar epimerase